MRLSEIEGEQALDILADIIDPIAEIATDEEFGEMMRAKVPKIHLVKKMLKDHKKSVIAIMAALDGEKPETYRFNLLTLPMKILEIVNDPEVEQLFQSQSQMTELPSSGSVTENTEGEETQDVSSVT